MPMVNLHVDTQPSLILCTILNKTTLQKYVWLNKASPDTDILPVLFTWGMSLFSHKFRCYTIDVPGSEATWCTHTGIFVMVYKSCCVLTDEWPAWAVRLILDLVQHVPSSSASLLLVLYAILSSSSFVMLKSCLTQRHTYMYVDIVDVLLDSYSDEDAVFDDCITYLIGGSHTTTFSMYNKMCYLLYTF